MPPLAEALPLAIPAIGDAIAGIGSAVGSILPTAAAAGEAVAPEAAAAAPGVFETGTAGIPFLGSELTGPIAGTAPTAIPDAAAGFSAGPVAAAGGGELSGIAGTPGAEFGGLGSAVAQGPELGFGAAPTSAGPAGIPFTGGGPGGGAFNPASLTSATPEALSSFAADPTSVVSTGGSGASAPALSLDQLAYGPGGLPPPLNITPGATTATPGGGLFNWITSNPGLAASLGIGAGSLLKQAVFPSKLPYQGQIAGAAGQAGAQASKIGAEGQTLLGPIQGQPLPAALEAQVTQAVNDAVNTVKSRYAQLGLSGSTMEAQAIAYEQQQAEALRGTLALQLAQAGTNLINSATQDLGLEGQLYGELMQAQVAQDDQLSASIANFAGTAAMASATAGRPVYQINPVARAA